MCYSTKDCIVIALRELMQSRPVRKIKVQDIMRLTGMTRQSFYYHFQDIYQVLEWETDRRLIQPMKSRPDLSCIQWYEQISCLLNEDKDFYRKVMHNLDWNVFTDMLLSVIRPNVDALFPAEGRTEMQSYTVDLLSRMILNLLLDRISSRDALTPETEEMHTKVLETILNETTAAIRQA